MVEAAWIEAEVLKAVPEAHVEVIDLHGSGDHFHVRIISETFEGVRPFSAKSKCSPLWGSTSPIPFTRLTSSA